MNGQHFFAWILHFNKSAEIITSRLDIFSPQQIGRYSHIGWPAIEEMRNEMQAFGKARIPVGKIAANYRLKSLIDPEFAIWTFVYISGIFG
jgi:hypothetical protein